jgi:hypothetical protein
VVAAVTALDVAFATAIVAGISAIVGPTVAFLIGRADRQAARQKAKGDRYFELRRAAYAEVLTNYFGVMAVMEGAPAPTTPVDWNALAAQLSAIASTDVLATGTAFMAASRKYFLDANLLEQIGPGEPGRDRMVEQASADSAAATDAFERFQRAINDDLASL